MAEERSLKNFPPNKALKDFEPLIGVWDTVGTHKLIPDTTLHGKTSFEWHESGAFIIVRSSIEEKVGIPTGVAIIGSDNTLGSYSMIYYDDRGVSRNLQVKMEGNVLSWWRNGPEFSQRYKLTIA